MKVRIGIVLVTLLCAVGPVLSSQPPLAESVPAGTAVYVGWAGRTLPFEGSMLGQFLNEPAVSGIFEAIQKAAMRGMHEEPEREMFRSGWEMGSIAWQRPAALMVNVLDDDGEPDIEAAVLLDLGRDRPEFAEHLDQLVSAAGERLPFEEEITAGVTYRMVVLDERQLSFGFLEDVFFAYIGPGSPRELLELSEDDSLAKDSDFRERMDEVDGEDIQIAFHLDAVALKRQIEPSWAEKDDLDLHKLLTALGLDEVSAVAGSTRIVERRMYTKSRVFSEAPHRGVLSLFDGDALSEDDLAGVPSDADLVWAAKLSPEDAYDELLRCLREYSPEAEQRMLDGVEQFEERMDMSLTGDVLAGLGDTWTIASAPSYGGFLTGTLLTVELSDSDRIAEVLEGVLEEFEPMLGPDGPARLMTTEANRTEIHYLSVARPYSPLPVAPAWAINDGRLYIAGWPQVVEAAIIGTGARPLTDSSEYRDVREKIQGDPSILSYVNSPKVIKQTYQWALMGWTTGSHAVMGRAEIPVRPDWLPALPTLQKYFRPQISAISADEEGITFESYGTLPGTGMLSAAASSPLTPAVLVPALAEARSKARRVASKSNLHGIGSGMHMYAVAHRDVFPPDLDVLVDEGYISPEMLASPAGEARRGPEDGQSDYIYPNPGLRLSDIRNAPEFVLVYERPENYDGRGTNVLFADGSVRWMSTEEFEEAKRRTEKAAGELKGADGF